VELLLSKGAYVDALNLGGTALHIAARHWRDDIMKVLLDHHADVRITLAYSFSQLWSYLEWRNPQ
jgi:ankyrin repeat protein